MAGWLHAGAWLPVFRRARRAAPRPARSSSISSTPGEKAEITFKRNGRYDQAGLKKINMFLRDWRRNEPTKMDPRLLDLVWEVYRAVGARDYIHVVSAYRSPATNSMLRSRSQGRRQEEPAHARQGDGLLHSGRQPEEAARHRPEVAGRRRRLLSALRLALRPHGCRQCAPLAAHEPQGTGRASSRTARRCMCRATASRCPASSRRSPPTSRARRAARPLWRLRRARRNRASPAACCPRSSAAAPTKKRTTARSRGDSCRGSAPAEAPKTVRRHPHRSA